MKQTVQLCRLSLGSFDYRIHVLYGMLSSQIHQMISNHCPILVQLWYTIFLTVNDLDVTMH